MKTSQRDENQKPQLKNSMCMEFSFVNNHLSFAKLISA